MGAVYLMRETFSVSRLVSASWRFMVRSSVKTACEREELEGIRWVLEWMRERERVRLVHVGGGNGSCLVAFIHQGHHLVITCDDEFGEILDIGAQTGMFTDAEVAGILGIEQVSYFFVVNLWVNMRWVGGRVKEGMTSM